MVPIVVLLNRVALFAAVVLVLPNLQKLWWHTDNYTFVDILQKMDQNRDGVVTIDEFLDTCQKDENIMQSMMMFDNVIWVLVKL